MTIEEISRWRHLGSPGLSRDELDLAVGVKGSRIIRD